MTLDKLRTSMKAYRDAVDQESKMFKDSHLALEKLHSYYALLKIEEREVAGSVLIEWLQSEDESLRFDALALVDDFRITAAVQALRQLSKRLASNTAPGARYELEKVNRIIEQLIH
jgi:cysteinyl-tRNA synthetase